MLRSLTLGLAVAALSACTANALSIGPQPHDDRGSDAGSDAASLVEDASISGDLAVAIGDDLAIAISDFALPPSTDAGGD